MARDCKILGKTEGKVKQRVLYFLSFPSVDLCLDRSRLDLNVMTKLSPPVRLFRCFCCFVFLFAYSIIETMKMGEM